MSELLTLDGFLHDLSSYKPPSLHFRKSRVALDFLPLGPEAPRIRLRLLGLAAVVANPSAGMGLVSGTVGPTGAFGVDVALSEEWPEAQSFTELEIWGEGPTGERVSVVRALTRSVTLVTRWDPNLP